MKRLFPLWILHWIIPQTVEAGWRSIEAGFDYRSVEKVGGHFFRIDPKRYRIDLLLASDYTTSALTAERYQERSNALLVINGGFFDEMFRSLGLLQRQGRIINPLRDVSWGIFLLGGKDGTEPAIIHKKEWNPENVLMAIQAGPRLVIDGKIPSFKDISPSRRSAVGITADGRVVIALAESLILLKEWAEILREDCVTALNLDGGGSSQLSVKMPGLSLKVVGLTNVPNAVAVFRK